MIYYSVFLISQQILILFVSIHHSFHFTNPIFFHKKLTTNSMSPNTNINTNFNSIFNSNQNNHHRNIHSILYSTIIAPPKVDKPMSPTQTPNKPSSTPEIPQTDILFKESIDVQKEFDESSFNEKYLVVLFNDPVNKRQYVSQVLMEVFTWTEMMASEVMLQAHTHGYAVTGEWGKETAQEYCDKLLDRGLVAEVIKVGDGADDEDEFDNSENSFQ